MKFQLTQVLQDAIFDITEDLAQAARPSLRRPLPEDQIAKLRNTSENAAGDELSIEDYAKDKRAAFKAYVSDDYGFRCLTAGNIPLALYAEEILASHFDCERLEYIFWGVTFFRLKIDIPLSRNFETGPFR